MKQKKSSGSHPVGNRTVVGIICIVVALAICFGIAPLVNRLSDGKTEIVRLIKEQENDLMRVIRITAERGNKKEFETEFKRISDNIKDLKQLLEVEKTKVRPKLDVESRLEALFAKIDSASANIQEFNNQVIRQLIAQIRIDGEDKMTIILTNGYRFEAKR